VSAHGPPDDERRPGKGGAGVDWLDDTCNVARNVHVMRGLDPRRREELQLALAGVPCSLGYAAGVASVLLPHEVGSRLTRRRLEALRREWHDLVDQSIGQALVDLGRPA
jgi:hypothetical protein